MMLVMKYSSGSPLRGVFLRHKLAISLVICLPLRRGVLGRSWWVTPQIWVEGGFRGQPPRLTFWVQILTCYFIGNVNLGKLLLACAPGIWCCLHCAGAAGDTTRALKDLSGHKLEGTRRQTQRRSLTNGENTCTLWGVSWTRVPMLSCDPLEKSACPNSVFWKIR